MMEYNESFTEDIKAFCAMGRSIVAFAGQHDLTMQDMAQWAQEHPAFERACKIAQSLDINFWEGQMINAMSMGDKDRLNAAKFMLDQKFDLVEKLLKQSAVSNTPSELAGRKITIRGLGDRNRDMASIPRIGAS